MQAIDCCVAPDGSAIAYGVSGTGPYLVMPAWWVSDLELDWKDSQFRAFMERLGRVTQ